MAQLHRIAIQMDPPEQLNPKGDSTIALAESAIARGAEVYYFLPKSLSLQPNGQLHAHVTRLHINRNAPTWWQIAESARENLDDFDAILMRQDPPFDMEYITATYLLERLGNKVFNSPAAVRNNPEKLSPFLFSEFQPETLVSADVDAIRDFHLRHPDMILKPLHGFGGVGVFRIGPKGENFESLLEMLLRGARREPLVAQPFLPSVKDREIRVVLVDGQIEAAFRRKPAEGEIRTNMRVGGLPEAVELDARELEVATIVGAWLREQNILLCGLDLIGGYLGEINITCPTGIRAVEALYGKNLADTCWDVIEQKLTS